MGLGEEYTSGQTRLDDDEKDSLLIPAITTRGELDEFEQQNIEKALLWTLNRSFKTEVILSVKFIMAVHKKMYGDVWAWAGELRNTNKNIGVDKLQIPTQLRYLIDDAKYWVAHETYPPDEIAIRFKHRIVSIHCFPNGNGRHSRLMADIIIEKIFKQPVFTWGASKQVKQGDIRAAYLSAIKTADAGNIVPLIEFARS